MCAVPCIGYVIPCDLAVAYDEVESVHVIDIAVPVIIDTVARNLLSVGPYICLQVRMFEAYPFIKHSHYHGRVSGAPAPCPVRAFPFREKVHIHILHEFLPEKGFTCKVSQRGIAGIDSVHRPVVLATVHQIPLVFEKFIIECTRISPCTGTCSRRSERYRFSLRVISPLDNPVRDSGLHFPYRREFADHILHTVPGVIEPDHVPEVEAGFLFLLHKPRIGREHPLEFIAPDKVQDLVYGKDSGAGGDTFSHPVKNVSHVRSELHDDLSFEGNRLL